MDRRNVIRTLCADEATMDIGIAERLEVKHRVRVRVRVSPNEPHERKRCHQKKPQAVSCESCFLHNSPLWFEHMPRTLLNTQVIDSGVARNVLLIRQFWLCQAKSGQDQFPKTRAKSRTPIQTQIGFVDRLPRQRAFVAKMLPENALRAGRSESTQRRIEARRHGLSEQEPFCKPFPNRFVRWRPPRPG